jgi:hypothetical protein
MWLERLCKFDEDRATIDEMVELAWVGTSLRAAFEAKNVAVPEWMDDSLRRVNRAIESHRRDALELRLREVRRQQDALKTPTERREALAREQAELEAQLATAK